MEKPVIPTEEQLEILEYHFCKVNKHPDPTTLCLIAAETGLSEEQTLVSVCPSSHPWYQPLSPCMPLCPTFACPVLVSLSYTCTHMSPAQASHNSPCPSHTFSTLPALLCAPCAPCLHSLHHRAPCTLLTAPKSLLCTSAIPSTTLCTYRALMQHRTSLYPISFLHSTCFCSCMYNPYMLFFQTISDILGYIKNCWF